MPTATPDGAYGADSPWMKLTFEPGHPVYLRRALNPILNTSVVCTLRRRGDNLIHCLKEGLICSGRSRSGAENAQIQGLDGG